MVGVQSNEFDALLSQSNIIMGGQKLGPGLARKLISIPQQNLSYAFGEFPNKANVTDLY